MRLKPAIAIVLCITGLPSLVSAGSFLDGLTERLKTTIDKTRDGINRLDDGIDQADDLANRTDTQVNQTVMELDQAKEQARQSIRDARNFSTRPGAGFVNGMDVIGLRLGMTAQEARVALQAYDMSMQIQEQYSQLPRVPDSRYLRQILASSATGEQVVTEFAPPPHEPVVVRLVRTTRYAQGARPTLANTLQALRQKYGAPTMENNKTRMHMSSWLHDGTGNKLTSASAVQARRCTRAHRVSVDHLIASQQQDRAMTGCGASLDVQLGTGVRSDGLVNSLVATLSNPAEMVRITQKTRAYINSNVRVPAAGVGAPRL